MQITLSAFIAIMTMLTGFAVAPGALATPEVNDTDAPQLKLLKPEKCFLILV